MTYLAKPKLLRPDTPKNALGYTRRDVELFVWLEALREWLIMFRARMRAALPPIVITESGCAYNMGPDERGVVDDPQRVDYHAAHLAAVADAIAQGVDVRGYYAWSLLDNFEWAAGYSCRYGLIYVDYPTQQRIVKDSGWWYRDVIASNGANL